MNTIGIKEGANLGFTDTQIEADTIVSYIYLYVVANTCAYILVVMFVHNYIYFRGVYIHKI